jgi:hypothetical protein
MARRAQSAAAMLRLAFCCSLLLATTAYADDYDLSTDECAQPDAGCIAGAPDDPDELALTAEENATPADEDPVVWSVSRTAGPQVTEAGEVSGGCAVATPGLAIALLLLFARRRKRLAIAVLAACTLDAGSYDDAVDAGPTGDASFVDVYAADLPAGTQFLLAGQPLDAGAAQPVAAFSLQTTRDGTPILRTHGACGDQLTTSGTGELLGFARPDTGDGTAPLVELVGPDDCTFAYETDLDAIDGLLSNGYSITRTLGSVWPPGYGETPPLDDEPTVAAQAACHADKHSPVEFLYASPGKDETLRFLLGCPGEVIVGEKLEAGPRGAMTDPDAHARGGRSAFVLDRNGDKLRELLMRTNGVERTAAYLRKKLQSGYDYIAIDEITAAPDWRDGTSLNRRLRKLLLRVPARTVIPYISIDLTQYPSGYTDMRARRALLRAFARRARVIALEVYQHTAGVMAGQAPGIERRAADRLFLASAYKGINRRAITVIGTSMHSAYPQYRYLDQPSHDLTAIKRQVNAIRHGSARLRGQRGVGFYFVNKSDMAPPGAYSYDRLIKTMRLQGLRFR